MARRVRTVGWRRDIVVSTVHLVGDIEEGRLKENIRIDNNVARIDLAIPRSVRISLSCWKESRSRVLARSLLVR